MKQRLRKYITAGISLFIIILASGCGGPALAKTGDTVRVHYTGTLADGTEFDSSIDREPLELTIGEGRVIAGFEEAVTGMKEGDRKTITIPAEQAYGQRSDELLFELERSKLPPDIIPEIGMQLQTSQGIVTITSVTEKTIELDANHPLAGKDLTFDIQLVEIVDPSKNPTIASVPLGEALASGRPTLAEFGSNTCVPCKQMKPVLADLSTIYEGKVNIVIIEVYDERELTREYGIMAIPTQIIFDGSGKEVTRHTGFWAERDIITQFKQMGIE